MYILNDTLITTVAELLQGVNVTVGITAQPITESALQAAKDAGGDAINFDPADGRFLGEKILMLVSTR